VSSPSAGFWFNTAFKFLRRSGRSTVILSLMIMAAVSTLIFLSSLAVGVNDAMIRNSVNLYSGHISGFALPSSLKPDTLKITGVTCVLKRIPVQGFLSSRNKIEAITLIGIDPDQEITNTAIWKKIIKGRYPHKDENALLLSEPVAKSLNIQPGDMLIFSPGLSKDKIILKVAGIYRTGIDRLDRVLAFCPYPVIPDQDRTWTAAIFLHPAATIASVLADYRRILDEKVRFKSWMESMPDLRQLIDLQYLSMGIVIILVFGVVSLGIACAFVIFILKNLREYGIMKAMGITSREMAILIFSKIVLMNTAAACVGILVGVLAVFTVDKFGGINLTAFTSHNRYFTVSGIIYPRLTFFSLCSPPITSFLFGSISAIWPTVLVARKKAADILRIV